VDKFKFKIFSGKRRQLLRRLKTYQVNHGSGSVMVWDNQVMDLIEMDSTIRWQEITIPRKIIKYVTHSSKHYLVIDSLCNKVTNE